MSWHSNTSHPYFRWDAALIEQAQQMRSKGMSYADIAAEIGGSTNAVKVKLERIARGYDWRNHVSKNRRPTQPQSEGR